MLHWINFGKARYPENIYPGHNTVLLHKIHVLTVSHISEECSSNVRNPSVHGRMINTSYIV